MEHALFGFTKMNTSHNGIRLGQALYKICDRLGIVHKVSVEIINIIICKEWMLMSMINLDWPHYLRQCI
jgi:hypothetical protein